MARVFRSLEVCTGAGGQALGLEMAGFRHAGLVEIDVHACATLRHNRPSWNVIEADVKAVSGSDFDGVDLLAAGVPCPPFSVAGKQLGRLDDRDLFPQVLRLAREVRPSAVFVENVPGLLEPRFDDYRAAVDAELAEMGYVPRWTKLNAKDFGVPQVRPRAVMVALHPEVVDTFRWPGPTHSQPVTVGEALRTEMRSHGWSGAEAWVKRADTVAPTLVGGSTKHGGPDLGPSRARAQWAELGVDGGTLAEEPPGPRHRGMPRLTVRMAAIVQGFPLEWKIVGRKTNAYRQVGNAFPPPVACAVGTQIRRALRKMHAGKAPEIVELEGQESLPLAVG